MVNLPNVEKICDELFMSMEENTGATLLALKERSGLSLRKIALGAGYAGASSIQAYFNEDYEERLPPQVAEKLVKALVGKGIPPITAAEINGLAAYSTGAGELVLSEQAAAAFVWHVATKLGAVVERDDPEVLRQGRILRALLKQLAARHVTNGADLVDGLFLGLDIQPPD